MDGDIQGRCGLVRQQQAGIAAQRHSDDRPLAHAAAHLVWVGVHPLPGRRDTHLDEELFYPLPGLCLCQAGECARMVLYNLVAHPLYMGPALDRVLIIMAIRLPRISRNSFSLIRNRSFPRNSACPSTAAVLEAESGAAPSWVLFPGAGLPQYHQRLAPLQAQKPGSPPNHPVLDHEICTQPLVLTMMSLIRIPPCALYQNQPLTHAMGLESCALPGHHRQERTPYWRGDRLLRGPSASSRSQRRVEVSPAAMVSTACTSGGR